MTSAADVKPCAACGFLMPEEAVFCPECGHENRPPAATEEPHDDRVGLVLGRYTIIERLAKGGMGEIYLARHHEFDQRVAVKVLSRAFAADEQLAQRFVNEARSATRINHPYAVSVYDFGRLDDGTLYILMEYISGRSLAQLLKRKGPMHPGLALRVTSQLCEVLGCAHHERIIHRDIKPDNIMVIEGAGGRVSIKVLDFGIAKILDDEMGGDLTQTGMTFGTPEYMSPEQAAGDPLDHRTDIYSLGIVLYTMLRGHPPFQGKNKLALLQRHLSEVPPEVRDSAAGPLPRELTRFIARLLEKEPDRRPQTMAEVLRESERLMTKVGAPPDPGRRSAREILASARAVLSDDKLPRTPADARSGNVRPVEDPTTAFRKEHRAAAESAARAASHGPSGPATFGSDGPPRASETGWALGVDHAAADNDDDDFTVSGLMPSASDDGFSLGDEDTGATPAGDFASVPLDLGERPATTRRRGSGPPAFVRMAVPLITAAAVLALVLGGGWWWQERGASDEGETDEPTAAQPETPAGADGATAESGQGEQVEPDGPPEWDLEVRQSWARFHDGDLDQVEADLNRLRQDYPGISGREFERLVESVARVRGLGEEVEQLLTAGECLRADERVIDLRDNHNRRYATRYYGRLDQCREDAARRRAEQRAAQQGTTTRPSGTRTAPATEQRPASREEPAAEERPAPREEPRREAPRREEPARVMPPSEL